MAERKLIREIRKQVVKYGCTCDITSPELCNQCVLLAVIDDGLAKIGKASNPDSAKGLKDKSNELMRSGDMGAAIKLYNRAWKLERR